MPVVLNESDVYREVAPPTWARGAIACFWLRRGDGASVRVLPDACTDIVWRAGNAAVIAGPDSEAWESRTCPGELIVGARLLPASGGAALGVPLAELRNLRLPVDALGFDPFRELRDELEPDVAVATMARITLGLVADARPDPVVQSAVMRLLDPGQRVDQLAASLGFSERQLRRRFLAAVGYGPKTLQRVLRLRRFMVVVGAWTSGGPGRAAAGGPGGFDAGAGGLAGAALAAGYADQAHLARECRALTGLTPAQLARSAPVRQAPARRSGAAPPYSATGAAV
jgi:AraC-like DNA-binding protein